MTQKTIHNQARRYDLLNFISPYLDFNAERYHFYHPGRCLFEEIYEGEIIITDIQWDRIQFNLMDWKMTADIALPLGTYSLFELGDRFYAVLGYYRDHWHPVDLHTIQ